MGGGLELGHAVDLDRGGPGTVDLRAHLLEVRGEIGQLRLPGRVPDHGGARGHRGGEQEILRRPHGRDLEEHLCTDQAIRRGAVQNSVAELEYRSHGLEARHVEVDRPRAEVVAPRKGHMRLTGSCEEGTEHEDRRPHLAHEIQRRLRIRVLGHRDREDGALPVDRGSDVAEDARHDVDVEDVRDVLDHMRTGSEQGRHHVLEHGVLGAQDADASVERCSTAHDDRIRHPNEVTVRRR